MKKNLIIVISIIMLFIIVFIVGNYNYVSTSTSKIVNDGAVTIKEEQLKNTVKLQGEWSFYPNALVLPGELLDSYADNRITIPVPMDWHDFVQPNDEGISVGTYHVKVRVPSEGQYGLYIRTIRQSNRIFINGVEVGGKGSPSTKLSEFEAENDDKFTVFATSENQELDIVIQVANHSYPQAGIIYSVEFGTMDVIQRHYYMKVVSNAFISIGYSIFGVIFILSFIQNRKRKEELYFGLFMILFGGYMSFINHKIFFQLLPSIGITYQISLQLGILPLALICLTLFIYYMYPQLAKKRAVYFCVALLSIIFIIYGIYKPFTKYQVAFSSQGINTGQLTYVAIVAPVALYNIWILIQVMLKQLEGARYILIVFTGLCCYSILLIINFLTGIPIDYTEMMLFAVVLIGFATLLNYRSNTSFMKVQALSEELRMHNQMKDEFLMKTSNELRTPLNGILNLSKSLMEGVQGPLKRVQQEQVILIHNVTQRLGHLVDDLLFSSHHMIGEVRVFPRVVPITVINEVMAEISSVVSRKSHHVQLITEVDTALPAMLTDELRFKQVLYNLIHNAIQHTEVGDIIVSAYVQQQQMVIRVTDSGTGIPEQELEHIFNAFYQVKEDNKKEGLGLGLSIAKNIVGKLNGEIHVASSLGVGTTFTFTMPLAMEELVNHKEPSVIVPQTLTEDLQLDLPLIYKGNDKKILIVEKNHVNIKVLADALALKGYTVVAVDNGFDAIAYIRTNEVDCMLIDLMMDGMSGYQLCKQVRKQHDMLELPIIILTAIIKHSDLVLTLQAGANDYLQKPIVVDELYIRIESLLAIRQSSLDAIEVEMNYLYTQVTPHFVYNTLNTIIGLSYTNIDNAREALYCLATYFRAKLNVHYRNSMVSIEEELELVKAYLYIEKMRFGERLTINYDIDESIQLLIPALSLQPLVENAIIHGISKKKEGGTIGVSVKKDGQFVHITIYDNGVGISNEKIQTLMNEEGSRIGFTNPLKKFKLIKNTSFRLYSEEGKGTTILIILPEVMEHENNHNR